MINDLLLGAPSFGTVAKHPFDIIVNSEISCTEDLLGKFRIAYWIKGHNKEREFLLYHYENAQDSSAFLYFLENFLDDFNPRVEFEKDFSSKQEISDYNHVKNLKSVERKAEYIRVFIQQKIHSVEETSKTLQKIKTDESIFLNRQLITILLSTVDIFQSALEENQLTEILSPQPSTGKKINVTGDQTIIFSLIHHMNKKHWKYSNPSLISFVRKRFKVKGEDIPAESHKSNALKIVTGGDRLLPIDKLKSKLPGALQDGKQKEAMLAFSALFD